MQSKWTRDYMTGATICAICGDPRGKKNTCCPCAPYIPFDDFKLQYFGNADVHPSTARSFYDDYLHSSYKNLAEYITATTSYA